MKENIKSYLKDLTHLVGVSGSEQSVVEYLYKHLSPLSDEISIDPHGNVIAVKNGISPGPNLMVSAHSDEIGFTVKSINQNGFITLDKIGGTADALLQGRKVWISQNKIPGIIGIKAGHMQTAMDTKQIKTIHECYVDVGASSSQDVEMMGIRIGDPVVFQSDFMEMDDRDLICTKSIDNRINCAIMIELFKQLQGTPFSGTLYGVITVREEVGLQGIEMVGNSLKPDYAIVLDTIPAGDVPDLDTENILPVHLGKGPACPISDGVLGMTFTHIHPKVRQIIEEQSNKAGVPLQLLTLNGRGYTTDAAKLALTNVPVGIIATPRRYSHSPVELVNINDAEGVLKIVKGIVWQNGKTNLDFIDTDSLTLH